MEWAIMVVAIVLITTVGQIYRAKLKHGQGASIASLPDPDAARLREELKALKERIVVLERLATDSNSAISLDREIEKLRAPDRV